MRTVLLVDDEPALLEVTKLHLEMSGSFTVDTCDSAEKAIRVLADKRYDAVVSDYSMPGMDGLELLREFRARDGQTPFLMMAGSGTEEVVIDALNAGATFYLKKGANIDDPFSDLLEKLHHAVRQRDVDRNLQLFSAVSRHDLLNRLAALAGYVELVQTHSDDQVVLDYMGKQEILISGIRGQIQFLEDYEKIGMQKPLWQRVDPALHKAASLLSADNLTHYPDGLNGIEIYADPLLVKVFYNLIDNSLRHGKSVTRIHISTKNGGRALSLIYEDNGIGIPEGEKEKIFLRGRGRNTGMGLFLIREILAVTGIGIRETGQPGSGVRFEISVPEERYRYIS